MASDSELILASRKAEKVYNDSLTVDLIIMDKFDANRRRLLALGGAALGAAAILPAPAFATLTIIDEATETLDTDKINYQKVDEIPLDRKSTRLNSSHIQKSRMPSSA